MNLEIEGVHVVAPHFHSRVECGLLNELIDNRQYRVRYYENGKYYIDEFDGPVYLGSVHHGKE